MSYKCIVCKLSRDRSFGRPLSVVPTKRAIFAAGLMRGNFVSPDLAQAITLEGERRIVCWTHYTDSVLEYRRADVSQHEELNATYAALIYDLTNGERFEDKFIAPFMQKEIEKVIARKLKAQLDVFRPPPVRSTTQVRFTTRVEVEGDNPTIPLAKPAFLRPPGAAAPRFIPVTPVFLPKPCYKCSCCRRWDALNKEPKTTACNCAQRGKDGDTDRSRGASEERDFTPPASEDDLEEGQFLLCGSDLQNLNACPEWVEPEEMYVVIKCKSKEQYDDVLNELEKRKEDAYTFGEAALENDLAYLQGTEKPVPSLRERLKAAEEFKARRLAECRFTTKTNGEEEERAGSSQSPNEGNQTLEDLFVKDEPADEEEYAQALGSQHSSLATSPDSDDHQPPPVEGGVSAHLLLMGDGEEEAQEGEEEYMAGTAMELDTDLNQEIKQEEEEEYPETSYAAQPGPQVPKKAKGQVMKLGYRQMGERCVREGCNEQVSFKTSSEWSMKCHHAFGHVQELEYECPVCGFRGENRLMVCRHMKIAHNQGFQPLFHPAVKNREDLKTLQELILDCFPESKLDMMEYPAQSKNYQPTVRAVMFYYVSISKEVKDPAKKNGQERRSNRNKCAECKAYISKGPLEWKLKCEHALTHSTIAWLGCNYCADRFTCREKFNEHSDREHHGKAQVEARGVQQLNELEFNQLEKLVYRLFPEDGLEDPTLRLPQKNQTKQIFIRKEPAGQRIVQSVRLLDTETMARKRKAAPEIDTKNNGTPTILRRTTRKRTILEPHDV